MSSVVTHPEMSTREADDLDAAMARNGFACPELGRGGFFPVIEENDDAIVWADRPEQYV